jgi:hypothetical protein
MRRRIPILAAAAAIMLVFAVPAGATVDTVIEVEQRNGGNVLRCSEVVIVAPGIPLGETRTKTITYLPSGNRLETIELTWENPGGIGYVTLGGEPTGVEYDATFSATSYALYTPGFHKAHVWKRVRHIRLMSDEYGVETYTSTQNRLVIKNPVTGEVAIPVNSDEEGGSCRSW